MPIIPIRNTGTTAGTQNIVALQGIQKLEKENKVNYYLKNLWQANGYDEAKRGADSFGVSDDPRVKNALSQLAVKDVSSRVNNAENVPKGYRDASNYAMSQGLSDNELVQGVLNHTRDNRISDVADSVSSLPSPPKYKEDFLGKVGRAVRIPTPNDTLNAYTEPYAQGLPSKEKELEFKRKMAIEGLKQTGRQNRDKAKATNKSKPTAKDNLKQLNIELKNKLNLMSKSSSKLNNLKNQLIKLRNSEATQQWIKDDPSHISAMNLLKNQIADEEQNLQNHKSQYNIIQEKIKQYAPETDYSAKSLGEGNINRGLVKILKIKRENETPKNTNTDNSLNLPPTVNGVPVMEYAQSLSKKSGTPVNDILKVIAKKYSESQK